MSTISALRESVTVALVAMICGCIYVADSSSGTSREARLVCSDPDRVATTLRQSYLTPLAAANASGNEAVETADEKTPSRPALFEGWGKPQAVFVFSGQQHGYLEPCGCSPEFQKGGLARRFGFIKTLQEKKWPVIMADLGGLLEDPNDQPVEGKFLPGPEQKKIKLETALESLHRMRYSAVGVGPEDLSINDGLLGLVGMISNLNDPPLPRPVNANPGAQEFLEEAGLISPYLTAEAGGLKFGIVGMVGESLKDRMPADPDLKPFQDPEAVLRTTLSKLKPHSGIRVLMLYGDLDEAKQIARKFPDIHLIVYADQTEEPPDRPEWVGKTMLVTIGSKGKNVGTVGIFSGEPRLRFQLAPLDDRFDEDRGLRQLLDTTYIGKLKDEDLVAKAPKTPYELGNPNRGYVGSKKCGECHESVYQFWLTTRHSHALDTLVVGYEDPKTRKKIEPGKHVNPECASCHTTGFFHTSGYDGTDATKHLGGNGCENCHGPGSEHVRITSKLDLDAEELRAAKKMMHAPPQTETRNVCVRCHDAENSPKFRLDPYWEQVEHGAPALDDKENWPKIRERLRQNK